MLIIFLSVIILYSFPDNACTSHIADKGTLIIPKRQDDSFRGSDSDSAGNLSMTVNEIQNKLSKINDITGRFSQTSYIKDLEQTQKYSGSFFIKKPFQMMWEYKKPRDEKVVIHDTDTWIYKKSQNQVIKTKFSKEAYSQVPIALLGSLENLRDDFDITMTAENAIQLVPKQRIVSIKTLLLETVSGDFPLKMFTIFDKYGNIIMIELTDIEINPGLDDSFFLFKIPPGAEVFDLSQ